jgi:hypothetical protein
MPALDVADVLDDPDFVDSTLVCVRNSQTLGLDGRASDTPVPLPFAGVVFPASGKQLNRKPDGELITGSISIITRFALLVGAAGLSADVVQWRGNSYTVRAVEDYSHFGAGFAQAVADLVEFSG